MDRGPLHTAGHQLALSCLAAVSLWAVIAAGCAQKAFVIYAPPEFAGGSILVDGKPAGSLGKEQRGYRWLGWKKSADEFGLPPRSECRGELRLSAGEYTITLIQNGYAPIVRPLRYDGKRPKSLDLASEFVTPTLLFVDRPVGAEVTVAEHSTFREGLDAASNGDYRRAAEMFESVVGDRRDAAAELNLALCLWSLGERRRAIEIIENIRGREPSFWIATYDQAVLLLKDGQIGAATALAQQLQRLQPTNPAYVRLASALVSRSGG
jgi:tetratricopeptide (TPR) repeat protein